MVQEVPRLAARQWERSANGRGIVEVGYLIRAFEEMSKLKVETTLSMEEHKGQWEMMARASAYPLGMPCVEAFALASVSVKCSALNLQTVEAVLIHVMYMLDGKLARDEMRGEKPI